VTFYTTEELALDSDDRELKIENSRRRSKKEKKKKSPFGIIVVVLLVIAAAAGVYFGMNAANADLAKDLVSDLKGNVSQEAWEEVSSENSQKTYLSNKKITFESTSKSVFADGEKGFYHFTKDGTKYYDMSLNHVWNSTYTMSSVFSVSNGKNTVLAETQGRNLKMYSSDGEVYSLNTEGTILDVYIGKTNEISIIMKCGNEYRIQVYSAGGQLLFERYEQDEDIYPVKSVLSSDGRVLAVSYMDAGSVEVESKILLFYKDRNDSKYSETGDFFAAVEKKGQIVPMADHSDSGRFIFIGDEELFAITDSGKDGFSVKLGNRIEKAAFTGEGKAVLAMGEELSGKEGKSIGTVVFYDEMGNESSCYSMDKKITYLKAFSGGVVVGAGKDFVCLNNAGKVQWQYKASQDISDIIPLEGSNILLVTNNEAVIMDIKKYQKQIDAK